MITSITEYVTAEMLGPDVTNADVDAYVTVARRHLRREYPGAKVRVLQGPGRLSVECDCGHPECRCGLCVLYFIENHWSDWLQAAETYGC